MSLPISACSALTILGSVAAECGAGWVVPALAAVAVAVVALSLASPSRRRR